MTAVSHVRADNDDAFWVEVQEDYDAVVPDPDNRPAPLLEDVDDLRAEIDASGLFADIDVRRYVWQVIYNATEYVDLMRTYSPNIARDSRTTSELLRRIQSRIEARDDPRVTKTYLATTSTARIGE